MGKRRIEKIEKIENPCHRKVTYCKRKKGLLKKSIELSLLCDLDMFVFIYDKNQKRVIHYASNASQDFFEIFNEKNQREFYSNEDYERVGGRKIDDNDSTPLDTSERHLSENDATSKCPKIFSKKRREGQVTSRIGNLLA